jgi:hypothetical protein
MRFIAGRIAPGVISRHGLATRHGIMLRLSPTGRITSLGQAMVYALHFGIIGLYGRSLLMELGIPLFIFLNMHILLWLRDKVLLHSSFITAHKKSSFK